MSAATVCTEPGCPSPAVRRGRCRAHQQRRPRASTREWRRLRDRVIRRDHGICAICRKPGADSAHHLIAAADGGPDELWNLKAAHLACHNH